MDKWVPTSIWRLEGLSHFNSIAEPVQTWWKVISLPSSVPSCSEFGLNQGRRKGIEARLLHQQSFKRRWSMIPTNEKVSIFIGNNSKKAQALFPSLCYQHPYRSHAEEGYE